MDFHSNVSKSKNHYQIYLQQYKNHQKVFLKRSTDRKNFKKYLISKEKYELEDHYQVLLHLWNIDLLLEQHILHLAAMKVI